MDNIPFLEFHRATPPLHDYPYDANTTSSPAQDRGWEAMGDNLETDSGSTYGGYAIRVEEDPFSPVASDFSPRASVDVRRYSDHPSERPNIPKFRRSASTSHPEIHGIQTSFLHVNNYDNTNLSPSSPSSMSSLSVPSPSIPPKSYWAENSGLWDENQAAMHQTVHIINTDSLATGSPDPQLLSPFSALSDSSLDFSPEPTRGRRLHHSPSLRHSPYPKSRSVSRITTDMDHLSITESPGSPYFNPSVPTNLLDHDPMLPHLNSFEDVAGLPGTYTPESPFVESPFVESQLTLFGEDYSPVEPHISPLESQTGFRLKVGSNNIEKAANGRRKRAADFKCDISGCGATFTAKHNLQNHINSHMGIRNYKCIGCLREFGTSHVLSRHVKKCKKKRAAGSFSSS